MIKTCEVLKTSKRLKDAELAAEVYRAGMWLAALGGSVIMPGRNIRFAAAYTFGPITRDEHEFETMNRFLHLPHYDEESYEQDTDI